MINRRRVLFGLSGLTGLAGLLGWRFVRSTDEDAILAVLRKRLDYLQLDETGMRQFSQDIAAQQAVSSTKLRIVAMMQPLYEVLPESGNNFLINGIKHGEDRIITSYLISSDFFVNGADQNRVVKYLGSFDPLRACGNPFSRPVIT